MHHFFAAILVNDFWLSFLFGFYPIMCMRSLAKAQQACMNKEGWNFFKMLEKWYSGYTAPLELNWVPKSPVLLATALVIPVLWSLILLSFGSYELYLSSLNAKWTTSLGQVTELEQVPGTNDTKNLFAPVDSLEYTYSAGGIVYVGHTLLDTKVTDLPHKIGQQVSVYYDPQCPSRSTLTPGTKSAVWSAAFAAIPLPLVTLLCVIYTALNFRALVRLRAAWKDDAPRSYG